MSYKKIFWGVLLVIIGALFILKNTGVIDFSWHIVRYLWPVILVLWGITMLPLKDWVKVAASIGVILISFFSVQTYLHNHPEKNGWNFGWNNNNGQGNTNQIISQNLVEKYDNTIQHAKLTLEVGAGDFTLQDTTSNLVELKSEESTASYSMETMRTDSLCEVEVKMNDGNLKNGNYTNSMNLYLNLMPIWDLDLNVGAAEVNFDLSKYKTREVNISGGAANIDVKLGALLPESKVDVSTGMADVTLEVPENAGVEIYSNTVMSSHDFDGFEKIDKQHYRSPGFEKTLHRISINLSAGMASIDVKRY